MIEEIIQQTTNLIEQDLHIVIDRDEFNYNRFCMHVLLLEADARGEELIGPGMEMLDSIKEQHRKSISWHKRLAH